MNSAHDAPYRYIGKYRGKVIENVDPLFQGRICADVPSIPGSLNNWALPCTPYAGPSVGFYAIPPIGANVWIEFEQGDPNYPVWVGCFWGPEDILYVPEPPPPEVKVFKTEFVTMILNDLPEVGGFTLKCTPAAVNIPLTITCNSTGITVLCPGSTIAMTPDSISISGETNIAPALTIAGETNVIRTALTVAGGTNMEGVLAVEGAVNITGGISVEGGGTIDGVPIL